MVSSYTDGREKADDELCGIAKVISRYIIVITPIEWSLRDDSTAESL